MNDLGLCLKMIYMRYIALTMHGHRFYNIIKQCCLKAQQKMIQRRGYHIAQIAKYIKKNTQRIYLNTLNIYLMVLIVIIGTEMIEWDEAVSGYYPLYWQSVRKGTGLLLFNNSLTTFLHHSNLTFTLLFRGDWSFSPSNMIFSTLVLAKLQKTVQTQLSVFDRMSPGACELKTFLEQFFLLSQT